MTLNLSPYVLQKFLEFLEGETILPGVALILNDFSTAGFENLEVNIQTMRPKGYFIIFIYSNFNLAEQIQFVYSYLDKPQDVIVHEFIWSDDGMVGFAKMIWSTEMEQKVDLNSMGIRKKP